MMRTLYGFILVGSACLFLCAGTDMFAYLLGWYWSDPILTTHVQMKMHALAAISWILIGIGLGMLWSGFKLITRQYD